MKRVVHFGCLLALTLSPLVAVAAGNSDLAAEYDRLAKEYDQKRKDYFKAAEAAQTDKERENLPVKYPEAKEYSEKLIALAERSPKDPAAADALVWVVQNSYYDRELGPKALALLREHHLESEKLKDICGRLVYGSHPNRKEFLETVFEKNPHKDVKGAAALALGRLLLNTGKDKSEGEKYLNLVIDKYGTKRQKEAAKGELFELHHLAIGKVAPEIEGEDVDGKKFKLSDYRGKVVVLDFWGDW